SVGAQVAAGAQLLGPITALLADRAGRIAVVPLGDVGPAQHWSAPQVGRPTIHRHAAGADEVPLGAGAAIDERSDTDALAADVAGAGVAGRAGMTGDVGVGIAPVGDLASAVPVSVRRAIHDRALGAIRPKGSAPRASRAVRIASGV